MGFLFWKKGVLFWKIDNYFKKSQMRILEKLSFFFKSILFCLHQNADIIFMKQIFLQILDVFKKLSCFSKKKSENFQQTLS